ncbi:MurR/RpiR family transcriptional regulator [Spiroplasma endosymbiont of Asaphidion curtum]|uniref:MurR/RpiR family transcriptional regulator n=1 Tax=Spiroplasma endosymbiont of Asaphidion curtum TaxID=3066281 RepID=UPI00313A828A
MEDFDFIKKLKHIKFNEDNVINASIATFILNNLEQIDNWTSTSVADACFTSSSSIIRFCQKLNLSGWTELKYQLKIINQRIKSSGRQINFNLKLKDNASYFFDEYTKIRDEDNKRLYLDFINKDIDLIVKKIIDAKKIFIFGFGISYYPIISFVQRLRWVDKNVICENDINVIYSYLPLITEDDVIICVSLSGTNRLIGEIIEEAKHKAYSIGIFNKETKLARNFKSYFLITSDEEQLWSIFSIRLQLLLQLLDFLYAEIIKFKL